MKRKIFNIICMSLMLVPSLSQACDKDRDSLMRLPYRDIVERYFDGSFYLGTAHPCNSIDKLSGKIAMREFNYITPSNDFKQSGVHPVPGKWNWENPDKYVMHANANGQVMRIHGPIGPQCSRWIREDNRKPEELSAILDEYMIALCKRYNGCSNIHWMDVVNETIVKNAIEDKVYGRQEAGEWFSAREGNAKWENPWPLLGYDMSSELRVPVYIDRAFELSNKYAPDLKQIINQHGNFEEFVWGEEGKIRQLVKYLRDKGRRVDGIGWQAHIDTGWEKIPGNMERLDNFIAWCHQNDLEFHITEMNVWIKDGDVSKETQQAETYAKIIDLMLEHSHDGVTAVNFWNIIDEETANPKWMGCLWRNDGSPRPAYFRIKEVLLDHIN